MPKKLTVFSLINETKIRCELIHAGSYSHNKGFAFVLYPIIKNDDALPTVIPLVFDPSLSTTQNARFVEDEEDKASINLLINHENYELIFEPSDDISFEINISTSLSEEPPMSIAQMLENSRNSPQRKDIDVDRTIKQIDQKLVEIIIDEFNSNLEAKSISNLIQGLLVCEFENISIEIFDRISSDGLTQDDFELWYAFKRLVRILRQKNVIKQDVISALIELTRNPNFSIELYNKIIEHSSFKKTFSREDRDEIHHSIVLSNADFFGPKVIKSTANSLYNKRDFSNAVKLFQKYIEKIAEHEKLRSDLPETYNSIGCCYVDLLRFDDAYQAFSSANKEDKNHSAALNNWAYTLIVECETTSNSKRRQTLLRDALAYINDAIQISPTDVSYISNRAYIEYMSGNYDRVLKDLMRVRELSKKYDDYSTILKLSISARIKEAIESKSEEKLQFSDFQDDLLDIFKNEPKEKYHFEALKVYNGALKTENQETLKELLKLLILLEFHVSELLDNIAIHDPKQDIYYYTSMRSLQMVLSDEDETVKYRLPLFNVNHMNDPREGKEFISVLAKNDAHDQMTEDILKTNSCTKHSRKRYATDFVFLKSFTRNEDSLPMWVHYADSGKGCCVKVSRSFFTNFTSDLTGDDKTFTTNPFENKYRLFSVLYVNNGKLLNNVSGIVKKNYENFLLYYSKISDLYPSLEENTKSLVLEAIKIITNKLRYLIKTSDYSYEQEMRIVINRPISDLKRDDIDIKMTAPSDKCPIPKIYVYTTKSTPIEEIILGPKVLVTDDIVPFFEKKLLEINNYDIEKVIITKSEIEYR